MATDPQTEMARYRAAIRLDPDGSDIMAATARQSHQHNEICRNYVFAKSRQFEASQAVDEALAAGLAAKRADKENKGVTMTELKGQVKGEGPYLTALRLLSAAASDVDQWKSLRESSRQRAKMIEIMTDQVISGLFKQLRTGSPQSPAGVPTREQDKERRAEMAGERRRRAQEKQDGIKA